MLPNCWLFMRISSAGATWLAQGHSCFWGSLAPSDPSAQPLLPSSKRPWNTGRLLLGCCHSSVSPSVQSCFLSISSKLVGSQEHSLTNVWQTNLHLRVCFVGKPNRGSQCQEYSKEQMLIWDFRAGWLLAGGKMKPTTGKSSTSSSKLQLLVQM